MSKVKFAVLASTLVVASTAMGVARSGQTADDSYLFEINRVDGFHVGFEARDRMMRATDVSEYGAQYNAIFAYDIGLSTSIYGLAGVGNMTKHFPHPPHNRDRESGSGFSYGVGAWVNVLDRDLSTLFDTVSRFRVQTAAQYSRFNCRYGSWDEISGNITFGIVNSIDGNKSLWPVEIALYVGPCVDIIWADLENYNRGSDSFGGIVGIDFLFDKTLSFGASVEFYPNGQAYTGSAMIRF